MGQAAGGGGGEGGFSAEDGAPNGAQEAAPSRRLRRRVCGSRRHRTVSARRAPPGRLSGHVGSRCSTHLHAIRWRAAHEVVRGHCSCEIPFGCVISSLSRAVAIEGFAFKELHTVLQSGGDVEGRGRGKGAHQGRESEGRRTSGPRPSQGPPAAQPPSPAAPAPPCAATTPARLAGAATAAARAPCPTIGRHYSHVSRHGTLGVLSA